MKIEARHNSRYVGVQFIDGNTMIDLGLLNDSERDELAQTLLDAIWAMGPNDNDECSDWLAGLMKKSEVALPEKEPDETPFLHTRAQIEILIHTKDRAAGGLYCGDSPDMQALVAAGLMESAGRTSFCPDEYFRMTEEGVKFMSRVFLTW